MHDPHHLLPVAYRAASTVARSRILAEEAGERAIHLLTLAVLEGCPPEHPEAWLRTVARRSACALLGSEWARTRSVAHDELTDWQSAVQPPPSPQHEFVREGVAPLLTDRQREALTAALSTNSTRGGARACNMPPRDFRRYLAVISRKAKAALPETELEDRFADDPNVQFQLGR